MTERILNDRYALEEKVGEGGMAVTYRARDLQLNRQVAIKLLREQFTSDPQYVERFRWEAQAAARLSHENIAAVYDTGSANGNYYIVMEFIEGTDLKQRLRRDGAVDSQCVGDRGQILPPRSMPPTAAGWCIAISNRTISLSTRTAR